MIGQATAHRRANAFAQALEDAAVQEDTGAAERQQGGHGSHAAARHADPEQGALLALAATLAQQPRPALDPERKTVQRAQLIAAMEQALADGSFPVTARVPEQRGEGQGGSHRLRRLTPTSKLSRRLAVGGLTVGVAAGALGGVAAASTNALPGDTLYGLKRGMEDLKLDMASGDASRGKVYLDMASTRLQEARRLMDRGRGGPLDDESVSEVRKALSGMHQEAAEGHRLLSQAYQEDGSIQPIETLNTFSAAHRQGWTDLRGKLPSQLTDVSDQVSSVFDAIDQEVAPLQGLLPQPKKGERAHGGSGSTGSGPSGGSAAPSASPSATPEATATGPQSASPSPSGTTPVGGLIGGTNPLGQLPLTPDPGSPSPSAPADHSVTLPPLLPGLLPGLGLGTTTDDEG
ncbi:DUF5667 domain-containing protein [Streptomyces cocklensis]|uniref:DUF5667 domain-containing protein n=1 Tax=Actinacidiphila cocklensis TaxID=887465 RepID=A0A9W4GV53_9ACTN|nr:DUF5667 domain-containing protein [Actinacidiphila cocklensis]MDD1061181.1 DUF5667 domain-containing protein [Actinacidiphila cocklensis]WSX77495.1 DUF5667 domain-containing protein [Streptomyces sp. NBC_00899]CAG6398232.1 conserved hypothetical protein [Actinacidiphila cocklensis]